MSCADTIKGYIDDFGARYFRAHNPFTSKSGRNGASKGEKKLENTALFGRSSLQQEFLRSSFSEGPSLLTKIGCFLKDAFRHSAQMASMPSFFLNAPTP